MNEWRKRECIQMPGNVKTITKVVEDNCYNRNSHKVEPILLAKRLHQLDLVFKSLHLSQSQVIFIPFSTE